MIQDLSKLEPHVPTTNIGDKIILVHGKKETWKTTFASKAPKTLILGFEVGYNTMEGVHAVPVADWRSFVQYLKQISSNPKLREKFDTIAIDTLDKMYKAAYNHSLKILGVTDPGDVKWGKAWRQIRNSFEQAITEITKLGFGIIFIDHSDVKENEDTGVIEHNLAVDGKEREFVSGLCDLILFVNKELRDDLKGKPNADELAADANNLMVYAYSYLNTPQVWAEAKSRIKGLAPRMEFTYESVSKEIKRAMKSSTDTSVDKVNNIRTAPEKEPFDLVHKQMLEYGTSLSQNPVFADRISTLITGIFGDNCPDLSTLTETHYEAVVEMRDAMLEMSKGIKK